MTVRIGLYAIPFGFGPVSKSIAIARAISQVVDVEWYFIGNGISLEFMKREALRGRLIEAPSNPEDMGDLSGIASQIDAAIVLMDNGWANALAEHVPVYFADSLGFMWNKTDFDSYPHMNKMKAYYVQNIFGAYENMKEMGVANIRPVPPIIDTHYKVSDELTNRAVLHMGGLMNPMNPDTTRFYIKGMRQIIDALHLEDPLLLMSETARLAFSDDLAGLDARTLPHAQALGAIAKSSFTWSSPGLTTLLEMAKLGVRTAPLPPQNYSQALNIHNMVAFYGPELHQSWHYLDEEYASVYAGMPETEGVARITELNRTKLMSDKFIDTFVQHALDAFNSKSRLPAAMSIANNGADIIANDIKRHFHVNPPALINAFA